MTKLNLEQYVQRYAMTEALHQAKQDVKDQLRCEGKHVSHYSAKDIHLLAEELLAQHLEARMTLAVERLAQRLR